MSFKSSILCGIASGVLLVLSLPKPDLYPLAWLALIPLLAAVALAETAFHAASGAYAAGFVYFAGTVYWIRETMIVYGGLDAVMASAVGLLFVIVYAFHFVAFALALYYFVRKLGLAGLFFAAPLWVVVELMRTHFFFNGFPWMLSGYALVPYTGVLQMASWTGIYGLSFLVAAVGAMLTLGLLRRSGPWLAAGVIVIAVSWVFPVVGESAQGESANVRIVQTNIPLDLAWKPPESDRLLDELQTLSTKGNSEPRLIVWPETPAPFYLTEDPAFRARMQQIARKSRAYFLLGYVGSMGESPTNSAALINPDGDVVSRYDKIHLVPFGEYVPLKNWLSSFSFAQGLVQEVGDFVPGIQYTISSLDSHRLSTAICYESIFPGLVREFVKRGSELIVIITNDGWFGESSAPFQHLRMGVVRAVENRRYVVRSANTGISAIVDPYGRIQARTDMGVRRSLDGVVRFRTDLTFYTQYGDVFAYLNILAVIAGIAFLRSGLCTTSRLNFLGR